MNSAASSKRSLDHKLYSFDKMTCLLDTVDYKADGTVIYSAVIESYKWRPVEPGTIGEEIYNCIMSYAKSKLQR